MPQDVNMCVHCALQRTCDPGIDSGSIVSLTRMKQILKLSMNNGQE